MTDENERQTSYLQEVDSLNRASALKIAEQNATGVEGSTAPVLELSQYTYGPYGMPRCRLFVDADGDVWQELKTRNNGELVGIQAGELVYMDSQAIRDTYGPLTELESVNVSTAVQVAVRQTVNDVANYLRTVLAHVDHDALRGGTTGQRDAVKEMLEKVILEIDKSVR